VAFGFGSLGVAEPAGRAVAQGVVGFVALGIGNTPALWRSVSSLTVSAPSLVIASPFSLSPVPYRHLKRCGWRCG
jgi:hypothetical protein